MNKRAVTSIGPRLLKRLVVNVNKARNSPSSATHLFHWAFLWQGLPIFLAVQFAFLIPDLSLSHPVLESASCCDCFGLWQDWQERCHWQSLCGLQQHRGGAATLVRHVGQPEATHCTVAHLTAGGGGRRHACSQEVGRQKGNEKRSLSAFAHIVLFSQYL